MENIVIEIHSADGQKVTVVAGSLGEVQSAMNGADPWAIVKDKAGARVAIRRDQVVRIVEIGEWKGGTTPVRFND